MGGSNSKPAPPPPKPAPPPSKPAPPPPRVEDTPNFQVSYTKISHLKDACKK